MKNIDLKKKLLLAIISLNFIANLSIIPMKRKRIVDDSPGVKKVKKEDSVGDLDKLIEPNIIIKFILETLTFSNIAQDLKQLKNIELSCKKLTEDFV